MPESSVHLLDYPVAAHTQYLFMQQALSLGLLVLPSLKMFPRGSFGLLSNKIIIIILFLKLKVL